MVEEGRGTASDNSGYNKGDYGHRGLAEGANGNKNQMVAEKGPPATMQRPEEV